MKKIKVVSIILLVVALIIPINVFAHPGGLDSKGCHYCRTNCPKWGLDDNEYHCHSGNTYTNSKGEKFDKEGNKITTTTTTKKPTTTTTTRRVTTTITKKVTTTTKSNPTTKKSTTTKKNNTMVKTTARKQGTTTKETTTEEVKPVVETTTTNNINPTTTNSSEETTSDGSFVGGVVTMGAIGFGAYKLGKRKKK